MSFNRTTYDTCSYKQQLWGNVSTLSYVLSPIKFENKNKCRHELGLVAGTNVSHIEGNLVDLESELRGQTRYLSKCDNNKYIPSDDGFITNDKTKPIDKSLKHLPKCQMIMYRSIPLPPKINYYKC